MYSSIALRYQSHVSDLMRDCFTAGPAPKCLREYQRNVYGLEYKDTPYYDRMKQIFLKELSSRGMRDDSKDMDWIASSKKGT